MSDCIDFKCDRGYLRMLDMTKFNYVDMCVRLLFFFYHMYSMYLCSFEVDIIDA